MKLFKIGALKGELAIGAIGTFGLKITFLALSFLASILSARVLGVQGYGTYTYMLAWVFLLQIPASLGLQFLLEREIAAYRARDEWGFIHGILRWSNQWVFLVSGLLAITAISYVYLFTAISNTQLIIFCLALTLLPINSLTLLRLGAMKGMRAIVKGQIPENIIQPVFLISCLLIIYYSTQTSIGVIWLVGIRCFAGLIAFLTGGFLLYKTLPKVVKLSKPNYEISRWIRSILPFILISSAHVINNKADAIMLGLIKGDEMVGVYTVASRGASLVAFVLISINMSLRPKVAAAFAQGKVNELQPIITKSSRVIFLGSLPIALCLLIFGNLFLLLFGADFIVGRSILTILSLGKLFDAATGSVGPLLDMTGHERETAMGVGVSGILNIILNMVLIPRYGGEGAAFATAFSLMMWNVFLVIRVRQSLGIRPTVFGWI
ncbi:MAG: flippase [Cyanobacteria bacterium J06635_15]